MNKKNVEEAKQLSRKLRRLFSPIAAVLVLLAVALALLGLDPLLAALISMTVVLVPLFIIGSKLDKLLGLAALRRNRLPKSEIARMVVVGLANVAILVEASITSDSSLRIILLVTGLLVFFGFTVSEGRRISRLSHEVAKRQLPPAQQKALDEIYETLEEPNKSRKANNT